MGRIVEWAQGFALALGAPGLFVVAILDSSILTLPEINDILVVLLVTRHKSRLVLYAAAATAGSIVGSLVLFTIGRKGGEAVLQKRFSVERSARAQGVHREVRRAGRHHPLAAAAADAVQDVRAALGRRAHVASAAS